MKPIDRLLLGVVLTAATIGTYGSSALAVDRDLVDRWRERPIGTGERQPRRVDDDDQRESHDGGGRAEVGAPRERRERWADGLPPLRPPLASPH